MTSLQLEEELVDSASSKKPRVNLPKSSQQLPIDNDCQQLASDNHITGLSRKAVVSPRSGFHDIPKD